jgi:hypothetical protein
MSAGSAAGMIGGLIITGLVYVVSGLEVDKLTTTGIFQGLTAGASNTQFFLVLAFNYCMLIILFAWILSHWINEKNRMNQQV